MLPVAYAMHIYPYLLMKLSGHARPSTAQEHIPSSPAWIGPGYQAIIVGARDMKSNQYALIKSDHHGPASLRHGFPLTGHNQLAHCKAYRLFSVVGDVFDYV